MAEIDPDADADAYPDAQPDAEMAGYAASLADGIEAAIPAWVERCVAQVWQAWSAASPSLDQPEPLAEARQAGLAAQAEIGPKIRALLAADVDQQRTTPLAIARTAVAFPTSVLRTAGVPPVVRDEMAESAFPEDIYDLSPGSFADLAPDLADPALTWGAAKAHKIVHRRAHPLG